MPLIYETIDRDSVADWIAAKQSQTPAPIWELEPPAGTHARLQQSQVGGLREVFDLRVDSGAVDVDFRRLAAFGVPQMSELSAQIATEIDERRFYRWESLDEEEAGAPSQFVRAVSDELWGSVDETRPVGPGGRVTVYGSQRRAEITVRHRVRALGGRWRLPSHIQQVVDDLFGEEPAADVRLRGTLGYFEASKFERQRYLRPAFVFLLDRPFAKEGPRWRVATAIAATTIEDLPLIAGLESAASGCP